VLNERAGRLKSISLGALMTTLGAGLSAGSVAMAMFIVARFIAGLGVG
jgi:MFS family permease